MGCGWIQFPVTPGSKKFEKIYPEGEFENFFVCNYGVGGNVPGEPIYNVDCEEEEDNDEDEDQKDAISDISDKLEEILQDSKPEELKVMQICLDALICLHERRDSCPESSERRDHSGRKISLQSGRQEDRHPSVHNGRFPVQHEELAGLPKQDQGLLHLDPLGLLANNNGS